ncbi:MAG: VCBS repeat-containing protein [Planctomycetota bacterium]
MLLAPLAAGQVFGQFEPVSLALDNPHHLALGDIDGDGVEDLVTGTSSVPMGTRVAWFPGLASGGFGALRPVATDLAFIRGLELADVDGDGDLDVVVAASDSTVTMDLAWYENVQGDLPPGSSARIVRSATQTFRQPRDILAFDVDGDGHVDVVSADAASDEVNLCRGLGSGAFAPPVALTTGFASVSVVRSADLDGDGVLDLVAGGIGPDQVAWLRGLGGGAFAPHVVLAALAYPYDIRMADVDGDLDLDVFVASYVGGRVSLLRQTAPGAFGAPETVDDFPNANAHSLAAADFDGDGDVDIAWGLGSIFWRRNDGSGAFGPREQVRGNLPPTYALVARDFDFDGDVDLLGASGPNLLALYPNRAPLGVSVCGPAATNSTGTSGVIYALGSDAVVDNDVELMAVRIPTFTAGVMIAGRAQVSVPNVAGGQGTLCVGMPLLRFNLAGQVFTSFANQASLSIDLSGIPGPGGTPILAGETWLFQAWFRDANPNPTSNLTDATQVLFH